MMSTSSPGITQPPGDTWNNPINHIRPPTSTSPCETVAGGAAPEVIPSGLRTGRVVTPHARRTFQAGKTIHHLAEVMYSDDEGATWSDPALINLTTPGQQLFPFDYSAIAGEFPKPNLPGVALDPNNPDHVYVVFAAQLNDQFGLPTYNVDLVIALSRNAGQTFEEADILRLSDADLGDPSGTDQFMPWVAIDDWGGINVLYYRSTTSSEEAEAFVGVYYLRLPDLQSVSQVSVHQLHHDYSSALPPYSTAVNDQHLGDYHMLVAAGCYVYAAYMGTTEEVHYALYMSRINLCAADTDDSGQVDSMDLAAFSAAYGSRISRLTSTAIPP